MQTYERRYFANDFEVRSVSGKPVIEGHAAVFNTRSQNLGGFVEQVLPGAFDATLAADDIRALFNHDPNHVLGRNSSGTLELSTDSTGLAYRIMPPDTTFARDLVVSMERGDISQSSFGFMVPPNGADWSYADDDTPVRSLNTVKLLDISPVTYPAYTEADSGVAKRSLDAFLAEHRNTQGHGNPANLALALNFRRRAFQG